MKKIFCFDIDNIICKTFKNKYKTSKPNIKVIKLINSLFNKGHTIKFSLQGSWEEIMKNRTKAKQQGYEFTKKQLKNGISNTTNLYLENQVMIILLMIKQWDLKKLVQ